MCCAAVWSYGGRHVHCSSSGKRDGTRARPRSCGARARALVDSGVVRRAGRLAAPAPSFWPDACGTEPEAGCSCRVASFPLAQAAPAVHACPPVPPAGSRAAPPPTHHACMHAHGTITCQLRQSCQWHVPMLNLPCRPRRSPAEIALLRRSRCWAIPSGRLPEPRPPATR